MEKSVKKKKFLCILLLIQIVILAFLIIYPNLSISKAVKWKQADSFNITAASVRAPVEQKELLNKSISDYLSSFDGYYEQDILHYNYIRVVSSTRNVSVIEIKTELFHNITQETKEYTPIGEVVKELWVYADGSTLKYDWVEISNTVNV